MFEARLGGTVTNLSMMKKPAISMIAQKLFLLKKGESNFVNFEANLAIRLPKNKKIKKYN